MIVVDANVLVPFLVPGPETAESEAVFTKDPDWAGSALLRNELRNVLAVHVRLNKLSLEDALAAAAEFEEVFGENTIDVRSDTVLKLSVQSGCTAYDCEYVALAEVLRVPLVTHDKAILKAFPEIAVRPAQFLKA